MEEEIVDLAHTVEGDHQEEETDGERTISPDNVSGVLDEMEEGSRLSGHRRARESGEGGEDDGDGDDEEAVVRRRRPPDPRKVRRDAIRAYYRSGSLQYLHICPCYIYR